MIGIYKIENLITHKVYIGQSIDIEQRWKVHKQPSTYLDPLKESYYYKIYTAFREYGLNNFEFSVIELCTKEQLNKKEIHWIKQYNSYEDGYNMTIGGDGVNKPSEYKIYQYDYLGNFVQEFANVRTAAESMHIGVDNIYSSLCKHYLCNGYQWSYEKVDKMPMYDGYKIPVVAYDLNGNQVQIYCSIQKATEATGDSYTCIINACKYHIYNNTCKYQWRFAKDFYNILNIEKSIYYIPTAVSQYTLDGIFIKNYNNFEEIRKELKLDKNISFSNLSNCLMKKQKSFQGYLWTYYNEPAPEPYIDNRIGHTTSSATRKIKQFNKQNEFIKEYISAHEAARQIGKPKCANHITECCQGKRKTCEGYIWKYNEE